MWLPETWAQPGGGEEQEFQAVEEQPPTTSSGGEMLPDRSLCRQREEH